MSNNDPAQSRPLSRHSQPVQDDELADFLNGLERTIEIETEHNFRVLDNHLKSSQVVVANKAALSEIHDAELLIKAIIADPS